MLKQTHTLYYGSDFLPFLELLPNLVDEDGPWALKVTGVSPSFEEESDGSTVEEVDLDGVERETEESPIVAKSTVLASSGGILEPASNGERLPSRDRKSSLPLSAKTFLGTAATSPNQMRSSPFASPPSGKDVLARLVKAANAVLHFDPEMIAQEITRRELELFLQIEVSTSSFFFARFLSERSKPRDWLRHTLVSGKKDPHHDKIARFNSAYNDLHEW